MNEQNRIQRRIGIMQQIGYLTDFPLAFWESNLFSLESETKIKKPVTYRIYKHANCEGCIKAGWQHWYAIYCLRPDLWEEGKIAENKIGYMIHKDRYLEEREQEFKEMKEEKGVCPSEKMDARTFWAEVERRMPGESSMFPCECAI